MPTVQEPQFLAVAPLAGREAAHPSIDHDQISALVDRFYDRVWADPALGPIFKYHIGEDRTAHLEKMKSFWSAVLLKTGAYKGRPVPAHKKLTEVKTEDFVDWLGHFRTVAREVFSAEAAPIVIDKAERIASSLGQAMGLHLVDQAL